MPRKKRICLPELTYHATSRCIEKKPLMKNDKMKDLMIFVVKAAGTKYSFELVGYAIMDNHFHIFIRTVNGGENISRIMQYIKSQFARRYNKIMRRSGPFWNERFGDNIIEFTKNPAFTFFWVLSYINYNPVRSRYVNNPCDYKYSSINCYLDEKHVSPLKVTLHKYFLDLGATFKERVKLFLEYDDMYRRRIFPDYIFE
jgi:putative transposase